jgi:hypothetical protein
VIFYSLNDEHIRTVLDFGLQHTQES